jgi:hypothetical protein
MYDMWGRMLKIVARHKGYKSITRVRVWHAEHEKCKNVMVRLEDQVVYLTSYKLSLAISTTYKCVLLCTLKITFVFYDLRS